MGAPVKAYTFPNGMMIVFDQDGQQVPAYQGPTDDYLPILRQDFPGVQVNPATWDGKRENPIVPTIVSGPDRARGEEG